MQDVQQFSNAPQAVGSRQKYRDPADMGGSGKNNLMHDKRVVRGNTYASLVAPQEDAGEVQKQREAQRRRLMRANQTRKRVATPEPVIGRKHMDMQTDTYLEELTERTVEGEAETQTDFLLDRPPSPLFMPAKIGVDTQTQIEDGDLFDFDVECIPLLEVLVGKTLEQSMMEVLEEEELESLRRHQEDFEKRRNAELLEVQRMEAAEKRRHDEMERRLQQQLAQRDQDLSMMRKVVARSLSQAHMSSLRDRALAQLLDAGVFADNMQLTVESGFMPGLMEMVSQQMQQRAENLQLVTKVTQSAVLQRLATHEAALNHERRRLAAIDEAERQAREEKRQDRERRDAEKVRIADEQSRMLEWEATQPPPPEPEEVQILELKDGVLVLSDERTVPCPPDNVQEVEALLATELQEGQRVVAIYTAFDPPTIEGFRIDGLNDPAAEDAAGREGVPADTEGADAEEVAE